MKLYYAPGACSLSPHIALREAGIDADLVKVDTKTHRLENGGDYYVINAKGYVPTLELDDAQRLTEGPAIVQYIADRKPASRLVAAETPDEYKAIAKQKIAKRFDWLAEQLVDRDYLMGSAFTVADGYLFVMLRWTRFTGIDLNRWPVLAAYHDRVAARPKVKAAMLAEGLIKAADKQAA